MRNFSKEKKQHTREWSVFGSVKEKWTLIAIDLHLILEALVSSESSFLLKAVRNIQSRFLVVIIQFYKFLYSYRIIAKAVSCNPVQF